VWISTPVPVGRRARGRIEIKERKAKKRAKKREVKNGVFVYTKASFSLCFNSILVLSNSNKFVFINKVKG